MPKILNETARKMFMREFMGMTPERQSATIESLQMLHEASTDSGPQALPKPKRAAQKSLIEEPEGPRAA